MSCMYLANTPHQLQNEILYVGFNQDFGCVAVGTEKGFVIYNVDPFQETFKREFKDGPRDGGPQDGPHEAFHCPDGPQAGGPKELA